MRPLQIVNGLVIIAGLTAMAYGVSQMLQPAVNPDPNHTHADFAVWTNGKKLDFSDAKYMSESFVEKEGYPQVVYGPENFLHLHDGNGHVIHRHKPGLSLLDFFVSIGFGASSTQGSGICLTPGDPLSECVTGALRLFVNGKEIQNSHPFDYVFVDTDKILLTDATSQEEIDRELTELTRDACLYSRTCPWRGDPPTENCIADPTVPCVAQ